MDFSTLSPPVRLALAYAHSDLRAAWAVLLVFDARIGDVVGQSSEPLFTQMKVAWWQEVLAKPEHLRPQGEPLLAELSKLEDTVQATSVIPAMQLLLDAWGLLAARESWSPDTLQAFAEARAAAVFGTYASWVAPDRHVEEWGRRWAIDDLSARFGKEFCVWENVRSYGMHRRLRPLSILALSARPEISGAGLVWHALTGR